MLVSDEAPEHDVSASPKFHMIPGSSRLVCC